MVNLDVEPSSPSPPSTTMAPLNYQYDLIDDPSSVYGSGSSGEDYSYNEVAASPSFLEGGDRSLSPASNALIAADSLLNRSLAADSPKSSNTDYENDPFSLIMESRTSESNEFRTMIVCIGLLIISVGILANLLFALLVVCKRRRRRSQTPPPASSLLIMTSMSLVFLLLLVSYCMKISVYFTGDNIIKFHIYDTIENWSFGEFACKLISALPVCCKLFSRLSLLALVLKRLFGLLFTCDLDRTDSSFNDDSVVIESSSGDADVNIIRTRPSSGIRVKSRRSGGGGQRRSTTANIGRKLARFLRRLFDWPLINLLIGLALLVSIAASWPLFSTYMVSDGVCDSQFRFPEDIRAVQSLWFNYLIYGLVLPLSLVFVLLVALFVLQTSYCVSLFDHANQNGSNMSTSTFSSSQQSTPNRKLHLKSSSTASFDEINSSNVTNKDDHSSSASTSSTSSSSAPCSPRHGRSNNILLWVMWALMLSTSLPQELYRYSQLKIDFNNDQVLTNYLESILTQPIVRARPYYAMQLIYMSEFALMPLVFMLFYIFTTRVVLQKSRNQARQSFGQATKSRRSHRGLFSSIFYDPDLTSQTAVVSTTTCNRRSGLNAHKSALDSVETAKNGGLFRGRNVDSNQYPLLAGQKQSSSEPKLIYSKSLKPTPFEIAAHSVTASDHHFTHFNQPNFYQASTNSSTTSSNTNTTAPLSSGGGSNVLHIIQHPSWRINIKQQPHQSTHNNVQHFSINNSNNAQQHLPDEHLSFNYTKNGLFKS